MPARSAAPRRRSPCSRPSATSPDRPRYSATPTGLTSCSANPVKAHIPPTGPRLAPKARRTSQPGKLLGQPRLRRAPPWQPGRSRRMLQPRPQHLRPARQPPLRSRHPQPRHTRHAAGGTEAAREAWRQALAILEDLDQPDAGHARAKLGHPAAWPHPPADPDPEESAPRCPAAHPISADPSIPPGERSKSVTSRGWPAAR